MTFSLQITDRNGCCTTQEFATTWAEAWAAYTAMWHNDAIASVELWQDDVRLGRWAHGGDEAISRQHDIAVMNAMELREGDVYRTTVATWTVKFIANDGMICFRRDDGRTAWFGAKEFAGWIVEKLNWPADHLKEGVEVMSSANALQPKLLADFPIGTRVRMTERAIRGIFQCSPSCWPSHRARRGTVIGVKLYPGIGLETLRIAWDDGWALQTLHPNNLTAIE